MKLLRPLALGLAALAIAQAPTWAASAGSSASMYDITFEVSSLDGSSAPWLTFGDPSSEATYVQAGAYDANGNANETFTSATTLFASLYRSASITAGASQSFASASTGSNWLSASGSTTIAGGSFSAEAGLNQDYQGSSTLAGWLTLAPMTELTFSGSYDLSAWYGGTPCGPTLCSSAWAQARFGLGDETGTEWLPVSGDSGPSLAQVIGGHFSLTYRNETSSAIDLLFITTATVWGMAADAIDATVPEPSTLASLLLGLGGLAVWGRRRPRTGVGVGASLPAAA